MKQQLSLGIDLDPLLKKALVKAVKPWRDLPVRWHDAQSYHIPLLTLGWVDDDLLGELGVRIGSVAAATKVWDTTFDTITLGGKQRDDARMPPKIVHLTGPIDPALTALYNALHDTLMRQHTDVHAFAPHVPLGHIRAIKWAALETPPVIDMPFPFTLDITALTLFAVTVEDGKRTFAPLEMFDLA